MSNSSSSGGIGFFGLLTIVFIVLKLVGYITWSWFWVLSPVLLPTLIVVGILVPLYVVAFAITHGWLSQSWRAIKVSCRQWKAKTFKEKVEK